MWHGSNARQKVPRIGSSETAEAIRPSAQQVLMLSKYGEKSTNPINTITQSIQKGTSL